MTDRLFYRILQLSTMKLFRLVGDNQIRMTRNDCELLFQCRFPQLSLYNADLNVTDQRKLSSTCNAKSYPVIIENNRVRLTRPYFDCIVTFYLGQGDASYKRTSTKLIYNRTTQLLSDYFDLQCGRTMRRSASSRVPYASVHHNEHVHRRLANFPRKEDEFNVLVLGIDSVSRLQFERMLPNTFDYLTKELEAVVLKGLWIVVKFKNTIVSLMFCVRLQHPRRWYAPTTYSHAHFFQRNRITHNFASIS